MLSLIAALAASASAQQKQAGWNGQPDPPVKPLVWPATLKLTIAQPERAEEILFPSSLSEYCMVGLDAYESSQGEVWSLTEGKRVGGIKGTVQKAIKRALSTDGKFLAIAPLDRAKANEIEVWSTETGNRVSTFPADDKALPLTILDFAGPGEVLTFTFGQQAGKFVYHLRVWDAQSGKALRQFDLDKNLPGERKYDLSPGRRLLACIVSSNVLIYDLQTGQLRGTLTPPAKTEDGGFVSAESVRFSPDGTELACLSDGLQGAVLSVYDLGTGAETLKHELPSAVKQSITNIASYKGPRIDFVESPRGFLYGGAGLIDRESGLHLWTYVPGILEFSHWTRILTPAGFIASVGGNSKRSIQVLPFPAESIQKSLDAYRNDAPAIVKVGEKVKVAIKVGQVRFGKPDEVKSSIQEKLAERLAIDGLEVGDDGGTTIAVDYKEGVGKTLQEFTGGNPIRGGGTPTGRQVQSTSADVTIKWTTKDGKTTIYETKFNLDPSYLRIRNNEPITDEVVRKQVFEVLKVKLSGLPIPYFVPEDKTMSPLPVATHSPENKAAGGDPLKKKIDARRTTIRRPNR